MNTERGETRQSFNLPTRSVGNGCVERHADDGNVVLLGWMGEALDMIQVCE